MPWDVLQSSIKAEPLVPALQADGTLQFLRAQEVVWLPPSFVEILPADFLVAWLGCAPLASAHLKDAAWLPLWQSLRQIDARLLEQRRRALEAALARRPNPAATALQLIAALGLWASPSECLGMASPMHRSGSWSGPPAGGNKAAKPATSSSGREAWVAWLPQFHTWPVFYTNRREAVAALSVQWPDETWTKLSAEVREILEGSIVGERRQALHPDLLPLTALPGPMLQAPTVEIEGVSPQDVRAARACLQMARRQVPQTAIAVQDAVAKKMQQWQVESAAAGLPPATAQQVVTLTRWAMDTSNWTVITHAMAGDTKPRMLPLADVQLRNEDMTNLEKLTGIKLSFVSMLYTAAAPQEASAWEAFWQKCGLRSSFSFTATVCDLQSVEHRWLPGRQGKDLDYLEFWETF
eukprot:s599_g5.t1